MRILLDECVHAGVRRAFPGHSVRTVTEAGWRSAKDGPLLALAQDSFDVLITVDRKLGERLKSEHYRLGVVLISGLPSNRMVHLEPLFDQLLRAAESIRPGEVVRVIGSKRQS